MFLAIVTELKKYPGGLTLAIKGSSLEVMHVNSTGHPWPELIICHKGSSK